MPVDKGNLGAEILSIIRRYSGRKNVSLDDFLLKDIGIDGWDGVELADELEERYEIDFEPLIESSTTSQPPDWLDWILGRRRGRAITDMRVREIVDYIAAHQRNGEEDAGA